MNKNIILCGFMGSGKTTVGRLLAKEIGRPFIDMDEEITRYDGREITEIFAQDGEKAFRHMEHEICCKLAGICGQVIAVGGGTLICEKNYALLKSGGIIIFLDAAQDTIEKRLADDISRPLLKSRLELKRLFELRRPIYKQCSDIEIPANECPDYVVRAILEWLDLSGNAENFGNG